MPSFFLRPVILPVILAILLGCGPEAPNLEPASSVSLVCRAVNDPCPDLETVRDAIRFFASEITEETGPPFDPEATLTVNWYDRGTTWPQPNGGLWIGFSSGFGLAAQVSVSDWYILFHELEHERYRRAYGVGDGDHERGEGPWTDATNVEIGRIDVAYYAL